MALKTRWNGNPSLRPLLKRIAKLTPDPANARDHDARNLAAIEQSLEKFGQQKPVVLSASDMILAGHGLVAGATALKWTHVAAVRTNLNGLEAKGYALADNRTSELGGWDLKALSAALREFENSPLLASLGWMEHELTPLMNATFKPGSIADGGLETGEHPHTVHFSPESFQIIQQAAEKLRASEGDDVPLNRCIELICADYLA